jgi:alanine-glyoxylate transaminase/serine-glyoxylate transaminase/serine-pyruvate transaminase
MTTDSQYQDFVPPHRLLMGPGPSMVHPRVLQALSQPLLGHLDPVFLTLMNDIQALLRATFHTQNEFTIALSGTGSAGMEAVIANLIEPGDRAIVGVNGVFGTRLATMIERSGGIPIRIEAPWGATIPIEALEQELARSAPVKALVLVHAETSTGARQPLEDVGALCRAHDALLIVDAVTSLGGIPVEVDTWGIDACYSGTQKCLELSPRPGPADRQSARHGRHPKATCKCPATAGTLICRSSRTIGTITAVPITTPPRSRCSTGFEKPCGWCMKRASRRVPRDIRSTVMH